MNKKLIKLTERRATLVAISAQQRADVARAMEPWRKPLAVADRGLDVVHYVRSRRPVLLGSVVVAAATLWRPKSVLGWVRRGWGIWRMALSVRRRLSG